MKIKPLQNTSFYAEYQTDRSFLQTIAEYANGRGGIVYFGVQPDGEVVGLEIYAHTIAEVDEIINGAIRPKVTTDIFKQKIDNKEILAVRVSTFAHVRAGREKTYSLVDGGESIPDVQFGAQSAGVTTEQAADSADMDSLNTSRLAWYMTLSKRITDPSQLTRRQTEIFLKESRFLNVDNLNIPGLLLFGNGESIGSILPHAYTEIRQGSGRKSGQIRRQKVTGNIFFQIETVADFLAVHIRERLQKIEEETAKTLSFPYHILQSLAAMAYCYRDYSMRQPVEVSLTGRDLTFHIPGMRDEQWLLGPNYSHQNLQVYQQVISALRQVGYFSDHITGQYVFNALKQNNLKAPVSKVDKQVFTLTIRLQEHKLTDPLRRRDRDVDDRKKQMLRLIRQHPESTLEDFAHKLGISKATAKLYSLQLQEEGLIRRVGSRRRGRWELGS